jgi:hypothetical protein
LSLNTGNCSVKEVEMPLSKSDVMQRLQDNFSWVGVITIDDEGLVSCTGYVELKPMHKHTTLPVAFGTVGGSFYCSNNQLTTLAGAPQTVGGGFYCSNNQLTTLEGIPTHLRKLWLSYSPALPLLRTLYAQQIEFYPKLRDPTLGEILNRYAGQGKRGAIKCQKELIAAGFEGNARW